MKTMKTKWHLLPLIPVLFLAAVFAGCPHGGGDDPSKAVAVTGVTVYPPSVRIKTGGTATLLASVLPYNAADKTVRWSSNDRSVATVQNGVVAIAPDADDGATVTITATANGYKGTCVITVADAVGWKSVTGVEMSSEKAMAVGESQQFPFVIRPSDASERGVTWTSSNAAVASVDQEGNVTAAAAGTAVITVTSVDGGKTAACTVTVRKTGGGGPVSTVKMTVPPDPNDLLDNPNRQPQRVIHTVWYEPEEDPRQVIGYQLEDGTPYFDHIVFLYGLRLRYRNCALEDNYCTKDGLHACWGAPNMHTYLTQADTYLKPIRDRGIKVILSIVPNDDGVGVGNLFTAKNWTQALQDKYGDYPFNPEATYKMIDEIADLIKRLQIDGIAYDEEYVGDWKPAGGTPTGFAVNGGNILRFSYELDKAVGRHIINETYEWSWGMMPSSATFRDREGKQVTAYRDVQLDYGYNSTYGGWLDNSIFGLPRNKYGPVPIALADVKTSPKPPYGAGSIGIDSKMKNHLYGGYGVVMYYCLRSRNELKYGIPEWGMDPWPANMYGPGNAGRPEAYLSRISRILHGMDTVYEGEIDYPRRFQSQ